jgi:uncharacterized membrane protein
MNAPVVLLLLRLFHIGAGVFWVGGILIFARFIFPAARALGPAAGPFTDYLTRVLNLPRALIGAATVNIVTGIALYWRDSGGFQGPWMSTPTGMTFGTGGLLAIIALAIGLSVNAPTATKLGALGAAIHAQGRPPSPEQAAEMQRLQNRLGTALQAVAVLLFLATAAMALARYLT